MASQIPRREFASASQVRPPSEVSLPPLKAASSAREVGVSKRSFDVPQSLMGVLPSLVGFGQLARIQEKAPSFQLPSRIIWVRRVREEPCVLSQLRCSKQ